MVVATTDGGVINGIKLRQSNSELVLRDGEDREIAIPLAKIDEQAAGKSLMPAGLVENLTEAEIVDLVRFLSELGKVGAYAPSTKRVARRWQIWTPNAEVQKKRFDAVSPRVFLTDERFSWTAAYTRVSGELPVWEQPWQHTMLLLRTLTLARAQVVVKQAGPVRLSIEGPGNKKLAPVIEGREPFFADVTQPTVDLDLPVGTHWILVAVERENPQQMLRAELLDVPGSKAQVEWVGGK